ncbi:MAG TPA: DNA/RNA non-specific endonuclease [Pseudomonas sp.]|uniref:Endonuclease n=1 Tax=Pseudomonas oryzihabitans TaxID=47885 RepID=A0A0U4HIJ8_9PSED|nr:DNA/RNA non-specific endonuclease [Pseudomonas oryzihabitans]ALZ85626.1 endonuclease [Pseudomonas oryzihabitans]HAC67086.1 DNA/RNA non-specific endonuclease [Pseudomonas sp.]
MSSQSPAVDLAYRPRLADLRPLLPEPLPGLRAEPRITPAVSLTDRMGYQADFLGGFLVPWPHPGAALASDVYPLPASADRLDYTHFSVTLSRSRRMALWVGVNIDGGQQVEVKRGRDAWAYDGRVPLEAQLGEALYADNLLDRGHLVRRQDPNWGPAAIQANQDTFHFTNCAPQMAAFNQQTWLELEDYLLDNTQRWQARITIFSGPVLRPDDRVYRDARIPEAFWKVVAYLGDDGKPSASAYLIDQRRELDALSIAFGRLRTYQCSVLRIEQLTGIDFGPLADHDGFSNEERATGRPVERAIQGPADIRL